MALYKFRIIIIIIIIIFIIIIINSKQAHLNSLRQHQNMKENDSTDQDKTKQ